MSTTSQPLLIKFAVIVVIWYLALAYLPQIAGTCFDGECGFSTGEIVISFAIPLAVIVASVLLEMGLYKKNLSQALSDIGLTRFSWAGIRSAAIYMLPLLVFFPLFALLTNTPLATQPNWQWRLMNVLFINGIAEEVMMRGFVFRHLREGRSFWRAAALSTAYFAAYHLVLIFTAGPLIGMIAVVIAIPAGFLTAYVYERGSNTVWGSALFHMLYNGPAFVFAVPSDVQPAASSLYLVVGILISSFVVVRAYRAGYERGEVQTIRQPGVVGSA
ncbi:MAG: CPBP family intramembrane metalloprotease [Anaerolineae bacterium]|nr:CPBP family intramembrane metalloprotease [Anaerolineae bacterium]